MAVPSGTAAEALLNMNIPPVSSPEPELQRGRKRRRDFLGVDACRAPIASGESATFRGRCRHRSGSRYLDMMSLSRPTSQHPMLGGNSHHQHLHHHQHHHHYHPRRNNSASLSPSRRKMARIAQLADNRQRGQAPSRSRSPYMAYADLEAAQYMAKRRRQRTQSRSRAHHTNVPVGFGVGPHGDNVKITTVEALVSPLTRYKIAAPSNGPAVEENDEQRRYWQGVA
ncbi:hypothetical protein SAMD00023353_0801710 [Rosellinia necatrix]|uniref:Uncharacterized protein n=1 Tax=Rosellinia necatrix TaxID=77044 RepID=A0A1W2TB33_ROSNE|nr:hypothetical protein SAMD00023353_0801710 [Rosellinia necatrix]